MMFNLRCRAALYEYFSSQFDEEWVETFVPDEGTDELVTGALDFALKYVEDGDPIPLDFSQED